MEQRENAEQVAGSVAKLGAAELLAALSYMTDVVPDGCNYHSWHVALVGRHLASIIAPHIERDVFYAGLLHDLGAVGAYKHITEYTSAEEQTRDIRIKSHPQRSALLVESLPGTESIVEIIKYHHECWNGGGYPFGKFGPAIPLGSQILRIADSLSTAGCFSRHVHLAHGLHELASSTSYVWSKSLWESVVRSTEDSAFYNALLDLARLPVMISEAINSLGVPDDLQSDGCIDLIIEIFATQVDAKDPLKTGHSFRVAQYAKALAKQMEMSSEDIRLAFIAGMVHDCGRMAVPSDVLSHQGKFSKREMDVVRRHAWSTVKILSCLPDKPSMVALAKIAGHHHERCDGMGYPSRLPGDSMHPITKILAVVDAFDAMVSVVAYRALSPKYALMKIKQATGTQFDPAAADALAKMIEETGLMEELEMAG